MMRLVVPFLVSALVVACGPRPDGAGGGSTPADGFGFGRTPTPQQIASIDIDAGPTGHGLPPGRGDAERGRVLYAEKCAVCHGANGEGIAPNPALVGREPRNGFPFATDFRITRTIGNYWPHATTLFDAGDKY